MAEYLMNDSKNNLNADDERDGVVESQMESETKRRTSNIYERFINRVEQLDENGAGDNTSENNRNTDSNGIDSNGDDDSKQISPYKAVSDEEQPQFSDANVDNHTDNHPQTALEVKTETEQSFIMPVVMPVTISAIMPVTEVIIDDKKNSQQIATVAEVLVSPQHIQPTLEAKQPNIVAATKPKHSIKMLVAGVLSGILLSAAIIIVLNKTGLLSTLPQQSLITDKPPVAPVESAVVATTETASMLNSKPAVETVKVLAVNDNKVAAKPTQDLVAPQPVKPDVSNTDTNLKTTVNTNTEAAITLEDFREEAQSTLYREVED